MKYILASIMVIPVIVLALSYWKQCNSDMLEAVPTGKPISGPTYTPIVLPDVYDWQLFVIKLDTLPRADENDIKLLAYSFKSKVP